MKKRRLIPVLLLKNGWLVQSKGFKQHQNLGNPVTAVRRLSEWASDELIYLDISRDDSYDLKRDDQGYPNRQTIFEIIEDVSKAAFMPITVGGRIRKLEDIERRLSVGADKVAFNTQAIECPDFVSEAARRFGSQCIVISVDVKLIDGKYIVFTHGGQTETRWVAEDWVHVLEQQGAGEILINSMDRDGRRTGYDISLLNLVSERVKIPVIALGGVGDWSHFSEALLQTKVDAVAAANIFHFMDQSVYLAKKHLYEQGLLVRPPDLMQIKP